MERVREEELLGRFARERCREAFTALVTRYLPLVRAAALRQMGDPHAADDVTQAVFMVLARKAPRLHAPLAGWLLKTTRYCAIDAKKLKRRREFHEKKVAAMRSETQTPPSYDDLAGCLDDALAAMGDADRNAVVLHFLEQQSIAAVAGAMGMTQVATRKRIGRALLKLRSRLSRASGIDVNAAILPSLLVAPAGQASSALVAAQVAHAALHAGSAAAMVSAPALISKGAMHMMTAAKMKVAAMVSLAIAGMGLMSYGVLRPAFAQNVPTAPVTTATPMAAAAAAAPSTATLDNPLGVEIIAVGPAGGRNHEWWSPTGGEVAAKWPGNLRIATNPSPGMDNYEIVYLDKKVPGLDYGVANPSPGGPSATTLVASMGTGDASMVVVAVPKGSKTCQLRMEYAAGPWRNVKEFTPMADGLSTMMILDTYNASYAGMFETRDGTSMVIADDMRGLNAYRRYMAIENDGTQVRAIGGMTTNVKYTLSTATFSKLKTADIKTVRCEVRAVDSWIEIGGISLDHQPSTLTLTKGTIEVPAVVQKLPVADEKTGRGGADLP